jgi:hypothetical protein
VQRTCGSCRRHEGSSRGNGQHETGGYDDREHGDDEGEVAVFELQGDACVLLLRICWRRAAAGDSNYVDGAARGVEAAVTCLSWALCIIEECKLVARCDGLRVGVKRLNAVEGG